MFVEYYTYDYHYASRLNPRLYDIVRENLVEISVKGGLTRRKVEIRNMTENWDLHTRGIKDVDILLTWIRNIIPDVANKFSVNGENKGYVGFNVNSFKIAECWGIYYNKGQKVSTHNHFPYTLSFAYCVNAPDKSSPLVIEGERIPTVPGRVIFYLGHQYHGTLPSKVDGRCMIIGNVLYAP